MAFFNRFTNAKKQLMNLEFSYPAIRLFFFYDFSPFFAHSSLRPGLMEPKRQTYPES